MYHFKVDDPYFLPHSSCSVEIQVSAGEFLSIVGPNGVGKTTLLQRLHVSTSGTSSLVEQIPLDFFYDRSLEKFKNVMLSVLRFKEEQEALLDLWKSFGLEKKEKRVLSELSGGESQMVKLSVGLSLRKDLYLLDEPSQYLDPTMKELLAEVIRAKLEGKSSVIMVEHDLGWQKLPMRVLKLENQKRELRIGSTWNT